VLDPSTSSNFDHNLYHLRRLDIECSIFELFKRIYHNYDKAFILESLVGPKELSEMSIIGFDPPTTVCISSRMITVYDRQNKIINQFKVTEPLSQLRKLVPQIDENRFRYVGGAVGFISYDAVRFWERLPHSSKGKRHFPLLEFGIYSDGILYNRLDGQAYYFYIGADSRLDQIIKLIKKRRRTKIRNEPTSIFYSIPKRNMTKKQFLKMVEKAKEYIFDGDVFQVVLSKKMKFSIKGNLLSIYESLREVNPSPYMYLLKMANDRCIIGSSPEMLLRVTQDCVETFPIAGTRPILGNEEKNEELKRDLLKDEKEVAEHTMLVDLSRNDLGRICKYGTVKVLDHMTVKRFSHVQHIVSHLSGILELRYDSYEAFKALFPAGTVSGAPKVRAMEIIDELEPGPREIYAGAVGYFSFNGSCDFAIAIRSLFLNRTKAYLQSGAGIVMDSIPENEWAETEQKADAILSSLKTATGKKKKKTDWP
jgi:anthranilate synthase component I